MCWQQRVAVHTGLTWKMYAVLKRYNGRVCSQRWRWQQEILIHAAHLCILWFE
jgi:hypothetical protein